MLDADLRPLPPGTGQIGKVARAGDIPIGYYKDPAKSAETFVIGAGGVRYSMPGDFATVEADGTIVLLGRGSVSINSGGEKIYPRRWRRPSSPIPRFGTRRPDYWWAKDVAHSMPATP